MDVGGGVKEVDGVGLSVHQEIALGMIKHYMVLFSHTI